MPSMRIMNDLKDQTYFITFTVKNWYYLFDKHNRFQILEDSFVYSQKNKNLKIYAYVFMLNHLHFIGSAEDMGAVLRDIKTHLSKAFKKNILSTEPNLFKIFCSDGRYQFWRELNCPKLIFSEPFFTQKLNYIHMNPVKKQYVHFPEDWRWSSASKVPGRIVVSELEF